MSSIERMLPLYEAKMIHHFDHKWATYEPDASIRDVTLDEKKNPEFVVLPRYWVRESVVKDRLAGRWGEEWLLGWRRIARTTDERTLISAKLRDAGVGDSIFLMLPVGRPHLVDALQAVLSSFALDFVARQKFGGTNASFFLVEQLPLPTPEDLMAQSPLECEIMWEEWLSLRVRSLTMDATVTGHVQRAELDAACFLLYGIERGEIEYIMDTFPIVKRKDEAAHGEYRTKRLILEVYDHMAEAIAMGTTYSSPFDEELA